MIPLQETFYNRNPLLVAPELLGKILVRKLGTSVLSGRIVEVEAYLGVNDEAAHSYKGRTPRNGSLFKKAGHAYVHSIHMQQCLDIVTEDENIPTSVLIRALEPLTGIEKMKVFRKKEQLKDLTSGPGKLTQALKITKEFDGIDVTHPSALLYIAADGSNNISVTKGKRIGISKAIEQEFRFYIKDSSYISKQ